MFEGVFHYEEVFDHPGLPDAKAENYRLAKLRRYEYNQQREPMAKLLGVGVTLLDDAVDEIRKELVKVEKERTQVESDQKPDHAIKFREFEPWPDVVDGAILLTNIAELNRRYVVFQNPADAYVVALWVLACYAFDAWTVFPRLFITAPESECGKSTELKFVGKLVPRSYETGGVTSAVIPRLIEKYRPTLLLDEADTFVKNEAMRGIIDEGYEKNGKITRSIKVGDDWEPGSFSVWAPMVLAAIGRLHRTIESRAYIVRLRRRLQKEKISNLRVASEEEFEKLGSKCARWAIDNVQALATSNPKIPDEVFNRSGDNWLPLLAVADLVGGIWPRLARTIASDSANKNKPESDLSKLLSDIRDIFIVRERNKIMFANQISSADLAERLGALEGRPWAEYKNGKPITKNRVGHLIGSEAGLGIVSTTLKFGRIKRVGWPEKERVERGFRKDMFKDAWERYLEETEAEARARIERELTPFEAVPVPPSEMLHRYGTEIVGDFGF